MEYKDHKPALTFEEQLELLKSRGLIVEDEEFAIGILNRVNYYKLSGYSLGLRDNNTFHEQTTFEQIYRLYLFNKQLSALLTDLIESVEGIVKTQVAYYLAHNYGTLGYLDSKNFKSERLHSNFVKLCDQNIERNKRLKFVKHNLKTYGKLPVWVMIEVVTFGEVSKLYGNMQSNDQSRIARDVFGVASNKLKNWLEVITIVRNKCAHHGRLYNTYLSTPLNLYRDMVEEGLNSKSYFALLVVMKKLILKKEQWEIFLELLESLISEYNDVLELNRLGFRSNWKDILNRM